MEEEIARLKAEVSALRAVVLAGRQVDLVNFGTIKVFMYMDDLAWQQVLPKHKNCPPLGDDDSKPAKTTVEACYANPRAGILHLLLCHHWLHGIPFAFIDVGCQYGTSSISIAQFIESCGQDNRLIAFEPGFARSLVDQNIRLNGLQGRIVFEPLAVSNTEKPRILFTELGHSENNRVVNRDLAAESLSYVVNCTSIDAYIREQEIAENLILKIDTQGGEVEVLEGMKEVMAQRLVSFVAEFTPSALESRVDPEKWIAGLGADAVVIDLMDADPFLGPPKAYEVVDCSAPGAFVSNVRKRPSQYTDVLVLPRKLPNLAGFLKRILP